MNMLKRFLRNDNTEEDTELYDDEGLYLSDDLNMDIPESEYATDLSSSTLDNPTRKEPEIQPVKPEKVSLKLLQPKSHIEATKIADKLKEGCIVVLDIGLLSAEQVHRLVDFLAGVAYVLGGEMIKTNRSTIVISPAGVDITGFASDLEEPAAEEEDAEEESYEEELYEETDADEE